MTSLQKVPARRPLAGYFKDHLSHELRRKALIGAEAADAQVRTWWNETQIDAAVAQSLVVVAEVDGQIVGVGQRGGSGAVHVVYKLYVHPQHRGRGLGPQLIDALIRQLPADADRLYIEHFAANERAGAFYEREGFTVERIEPSPTADPALGVLWRARDLARSEHVRAGVTPSSSPTGE